MPPAIHPIMLAGLLYPQKWVMEANLPFTRTQEAMCDRLGNCRDPRALMTETAQTAGKSPFPEPLSLHQNPLKCRTRAGGWVAPASRREVWAQQPPPSPGWDGTGRDGTGRDGTGWACGAESQDRGEQGHRTGILKVSFQTSVSTVMQGREEACPSTMQRNPHGPKPL